MYKDRIVSVVIPAYNEEKLILSTISTIPEYVDNIIVVNDCSTDATSSIIEDAKNTEARLSVITNSKNRGVGRSIMRGYKASYSLSSDITVVVAGDAQMNPDYMHLLIDPLIAGNADYTKGDRLSSPERNKMPLFRRFGNSILTLITKISTGYWNVIDPQNGYTAINYKSLGLVLKEKITDGYGNPNDFLIALNIHNLKVTDVIMPPVYGEEKSGIRVPKFIFKTLWILFSGFFRRIHKKYGGLNLHPILLFYYLGFIFGLACISLSYRLFNLWFENSDIPDLNALVVGISFLGSCQFLLFALWLDSEQVK